VGRIAIDEFGTSYSSLSHLRHFSVDVLKIDRSFVTGLAHNLEGATLIHTLVRLGKTLSIQTIAEGIEQPEAPDDDRSHRTRQHRPFVSMCPQVI
jgi:EAL domain-containing protein (putative c-di-GMP-specific phosphodiesterase class I)